MVWSELPVESQGIKVLGTPLGHPEFVATHLGYMEEEHRVLLERIPAVQDVQSAWLILLHCAAARANYLLRVVRPALVRRVAENHHAGLWRCLCQILHIPEDPCEATARTTSTMPLVLGGMGPGCPLFGRVGVTVSTWFTRGILTSQECWWTIWKVAQTRHISQRRWLAQGSWKELKVFTHHLGQPLPSGPGRHLHQKSLRWTH